MGFPHSEIRGSKGARPSPRLIAACYVLHRLSVPRHPLNALILALEPTQLKRSRTGAKTVTGLDRPEPRTPSIRRTFDSASLHLLRPRAVKADLLRALCFGKTERRSWKMARQQRKDPLSSRPHLIRSTMTNSKPRTIELVEAALKQRDLFERRFD
jgi:hypothetical protein